MILEKLSLINFKNIDNNSLEFDDFINCFIGENGVGKTNVLDSIYQLAMTKSYFGSKLSQSIKHDCDFMLIDGKFKKDQKEEHVVNSLKRGEKRVVKRNGKKYNKFSDHIGFISVVMISPYDIDLIQEGSSTRRKFIDHIISQNNKLYLSQLINYNKILSQRNALLKFFKKKNTFDEKVLKVYDNQLNELSKPIFDTRSKFMKNFVPLFLNRYSTISQHKEAVNILFQSQLINDNLDNLLTKSIDKDRHLQFTSCGIHKDDLIFEIDNYPIKSFGSQGQQKSFLISLKLAQFDFLKNESKSSPILLFDDIFDKLDNGRVKQLMKLVSEEEFGQLFLSDTDFSRTEKIIKELNRDYKIFKL